MSTQKHIDPEDLALFAMQLLPPEEAAPITVYLEHSPSARQELAEIQGTLASFAFTAEMHAPSALARTRFIKQIAREKRTAPARSSTAESTFADVTAATLSSGRDPVSIGAYQRGGDRDASKRGLGAKIMPWAGWAVAAALALTAGNLYRERDTLKNTVANDEAQVARTQADAASAHDVLNAMTDQTAKRVTLTRQGALLTPQGRTTYSAEKGVLIFSATNLEPLETFKVYELWLIPANGHDPIPAGTFRPDAHGYANMISTTMPKGVDAKAFGITIEDDGGSRTPTLPILMTGA